MRATQAASRAVQALAQLAEIVGRAVGEFMVGLSPHVLGGIEFRGVRREEVDIEPRMIGEERADFVPAMDRPPIPEQVDRAAEMAEQVLEKRPDVQAAEIPWPTPEIQRHAPTLRRDRHATTD